MIGLGRIVEVGEVGGAIAAIDPSGRYVAVEDVGAVIVYDLQDGLAPVMVGPASGSFGAIAVRPGGRGVAVSDVDGVWLCRSDGTVSRRCQVVSVGALRFTADGARLLSISRPFRLDMFDAASMEHLDTVEVEVYPEPGEWMIREGIELAVAPAPGAAVAFAENIGDDPLVFGFVDMSAAALQPFLPEPVRSLLPGERVHGIALMGTGELVVLDSDGYLSTFSPGDAGRRKEYPLQQYDFDDLGGLELRREVNGPLSVGGGVVAAVVMQERRRGDGWDFQAVALMVFDPRTDTVLGELSLPWSDREELVFVKSGVIWQRVEDRIRLARWLPDTGARIGG